MLYRLFGGALLSGAAPAALPFAASANLHISTSRHRSLAAGMACDKPSDVILFWFGQEWVDGGMDAKEYADRGIKRWFFGGPALDAECQKFTPLIRRGRRSLLRRGLGRRAWSRRSASATRPAHAQRLPWHPGSVRVRQRGAGGGRTTPRPVCHSPGRPALAGGRIPYDEPPARRGRALHDRAAHSFGNTLVNPTRQFLLTSFCLNSRLTPPSSLRKSGGTRTGTRRSAAKTRTRSAPGSPPTRCRGWARSQTCPVSVLFA